MEVKKKETRTLVTLLVMAIIAVVVGCATTSSGPNPAKQVTAVLDAYHAAMRTQNVEKLLAVFSEDFSNSQGATKPMLRGYFEAVLDTLKTVEIDMAQCEISMEGDSASAEPVIYTSSAMGKVSNSYRMKKENDGAWRIVNSEQIL